MEEPYTLAGMSEQDGLRATMIGCPACAGVLGLAQQNGVVRPHLMCSVGHKFSLESLLEAKEEELEKAMWSVIAVLAHVDMITKKLMEQPGPGNGKLMEALYKRMTQGRRQASQLRAMLEETERPDLSFRNS
jgi:two-component system, chemotaxis family, protein-glutamate methylesterase/glutaminase